MKENIVEDYDKFSSLFENPRKRYQENLQKLKQPFLSLNKDYQEFVYIVTNKYKQRYNKSENLYILILYSLLFLNIRIEDYISLNKNEKRLLNLILKNYIYEKNNDFKNTIATYLEMGKEYFYLKVLVKSTIINNYKYHYFIDHKIEQYYKNLGLIIPLLHYFKVKGDTKNIIEDKYFKYILPNKYKEIDNEIKEKIGNKNIVEDLINKFTEIFYSKGYCYNIFIRQKTHFSIFSKKVRKKEIKDMIGVKLLFHNKKHIYYFINEIKKHFNSIHIKDYYENSKENGYNGIHVNMKYIFHGKEIDLEVQLRTIKEEKDINNDTNKNHFSYSIKQGKYPDIFKEIHESLNILKVFAIID